MFVPKSKSQDDSSGSLRISKDKLNILIESFYKEVEKLRDATIQVIGREFSCN